MAKNSVIQLETICFRDSQIVLDLCSGDQVSFDRLKSDLLMDAIKFQDKVWVSYMFFGLHPLDSAY